MPKKNFYAVSAGRQIGIFTTWDECKAQVHGFKDAKYKGFKTLKEAQDFVGLVQEPWSDEGPKSSSSKPVERQKRPLDLDESSNPSQVPPPVAKRHRMEARTTANGVGSSKINILLSFDGGSRGNPGIAGSGAEVVVVERSPTGEQKARTKIHVREFVGSNATNNVAEWQGVLCGLREVVSHVQRFLDRSQNMKPTVKLVVQGDSQLVIRQLEGKYECKKPELLRIKIQVDSTLATLREMVLGLKLKFEHVYRNDNQVADGLANEAMSAKKSWVTRTEDIEVSGDEDEDQGNSSKKTQVYADV